MKVIKIFEQAGSFAENKDVAQKIRVEEILPAFEKGEEVLLDFDRVDGVTQSFIHALISESFRRYGNAVLDRFVFKSCNETVKQIVGIVSDYMQEGLGIETKP